MSEASNPTPGPWEASGNLVRSPMHQPEGLPRGVQIAECMDGYFQPFTEEAKANAALIAEAGTVHHETGLTPRQLVEQRDALLSALDAAMESGMVPSSSVADGGASKYSAQVRAADQIRAVLALVKGGEK